MSSSPQRFGPRLRGALERRAIALRPIPKWAVRQFHRHYYYSRETTYFDTWWLGTRVLKCPLDLWIYQEILHRVKPAVIVETGTSEGGSAAYLASLCDLLDHGRIVTVDVTRVGEPPEHPRVTYLIGSSTDAETFGAVEHEIGDEGPVLVLLDSDHSCAHVRDELSLYADLVTPGSYLIVEDTNVNGHPVEPEFGPGPMEAVDDFLEDRPDFSIDESCEKFAMTFNPRGFLRRAA